MTTPNPIFHQGHYNIIADQFKQCYWHVVKSSPITDPLLNKVMQLGAAGILTDLMVSFAQRLQKDNPNFDPIHFLDSCSPDPDVYPFSEAWEK